MGGCVGEETEDLCHPSQMVVVRAIPSVADSRLFHDAEGTVLTCSYDLVVANCFSHSGMKRPVMNRPVMNRPVMKRPGIRKSTLSE